MFIIGDSSPPAARRELRGRSAGKGGKGGRRKGGCTRIERVSLEAHRTKRYNLADDTVKLALGQKHARVREIPIGLAKTVGVGVLAAC
jgi:hypothetical protein